MSKFGGEINNLLVKVRQIIGIRDFNNGRIESGCPYNPIVVYKMGYHV